MLFPVLLFVVTCLSTFWAGAAGEFAPGILAGPAAIADIVPEHWRQGLIYMSAIIGILLAHEMGHFVLTLWHKIPASLPIFIPMPLSPIGTMGAVIAMRGMQADRKQLFDIGIAGPLAGLLIAVPVTYYGVLHAQVSPDNSMIYHNPLIIRLLVAWARPELGNAPLAMNPLLMAGWVGMLVTGLNMLPVSQLDGGHVTYALFGRGAHVIAILLVAAAMVFMIVAQVYLWIVMLGLIVLIGIKHPPTANDDAPWDAGALR